MKMSKNVCLSIHKHACDANNRREENRIEEKKNLYLEEREIDDFFPKFSVSLFNSFAETTPTGTIDINDFLFCDKYRSQVDEVRRWRDKDMRRVLKSQLPCITPSGTFSTRSNAGLIKHSGLICIDIDNKENPTIKDWELVKKKLSTFTGLYYCGLSVGGNGLFCLIRIEHPEHHLQHFTALRVDFKKLGIVVDEACKDITRLRCISHDETPICISRVGIYTKRAETAPKWLKRNVVLSNNATITEKRVMKLVEIIQNNHIDITDIYSDWFAIGRAFAAQFGERGRNLFHVVSSNSLKYKLLECDRQYNSCLKNCDRTTIATFFALCKSFNIETL